MVCFFFGVNILNNRTNITWPLGGMKFLFSYIENYIVYFTWLQTLKEKVCTFELSCNILYVSWAWNKNSLIFVSSVTIRVTRGSCILQFCYYKVWYLTIKNQRCDSPKKVSSSCSGLSLNLWYYHTRGD